MKKHLLYLKYLLKHKYYVGIECFKLGLYWRGIKHDWSKFLPNEWFPYVEYFYGKMPDNNAFDKAWLFHQHRNDHHWQHWILREDSGDTIILEIPLESVQEMYCDWVGAGMAITGKLDIREWYQKNREKILLHPNTRRLIEDMIYPIKL